MSGMDANRQAGATASAGARIAAARKAVAPPGRRAVRRAMSGPSAEARRRLSDRIGAAGARLRAPAGAGA